MQKVVQPDMRGSILGRVYAEILSWQTAGEPQSGTTRKPELRAPRVRRGKSRK